MAIFTPFNATLLDIAQGKHDFSSDTFKFMLTNTAPAATNSIRANLTEVAAQNGYSAGGLEIGVSASQSNGALSIAPSGDITITASGGDIGPLRYVVLYNDTATSDPLVSFYDYGASITLKDSESLLIDVGSTLITASFS